MFEVYMTVTMRTLTHRPSTYQYKSEYKHINTIIRRNQFIRLIYNDTTIPRSLAIEHHSC
jgi:hypothetical protein